MNISTYEARIKALEDQLNPPAPGGSTGLLSVTVNPDITLKDGTSLNAKLAEMMPIEAGGTDVIEDEPLTPFTSESTYTVTVTPGSEWYAVLGNTAGEKGATIEVVKQLRESDAGSFLSGSVYSVEDPNDESSASCRLNLYVGPPDSN